MPLNNTTVYSFQKLMLLLGFLNFSNITLAQADFDWVANGGGFFSDISNAISLDIEDNVLITGEAGKNASFGSFSLNTDFQDGFLVKYSNEGAVLWAKAISRGIGKDIACDSKGNIYVVGQILDTAYIGVDTLYTQGYDDVFLCKLDKNGNFLWSLNNGDSTSIGEEGRSIIIDNNDDLYITGLRGGRFFLDKFDSNGLLKWTRSGLSTYGNAGYSLSISLDGFIYLGGIFLNDLNIGGIQLNSPNYIPFVAKYDSSGAVIWAKASDSLSYKDRIDIAAYPDGGCVLTGSHLGKNNNIFAIRYTKDGNIIWDKIFGGNKDDRPYCIGINNDREIFIGGYRGNDSLAVAYNTQVKLLAIDSTGKQFWSWHNGSNVNSPLAYPEVISDLILRDNSMHLTGLFKGSMQFGMLPLHTNGGADVFTAKLQMLPIGLQELRAGLSIFPNPASDRVSLKFLSEGDYLVELRDASGKMILQNEKVGTHFNFSVSHITPGIYMLAVLDKDAMIWHYDKIIID